MRGLNEFRRAIALPTAMAEQLPPNMQDNLYIRLANAMDVVQITTFEELDDDNILRDAVAALIRVRAERAKIVRA